MIVVSFINEVQRPYIIHQKFDITETFMHAYVDDFHPDIKGFFLGIGLQNHHHSCRLDFCVPPIEGEILIYVLMFIYNSEKVLTNSYS